MNKIGDLQKWQTQSTNGPTAALRSTRQSAAPATSCTFYQASLRSTFHFSIVDEQEAMAEQVNEQEGTNDAVVKRSSTTSLRSSVYESVEEFGRTYHAYKSGSKLHFPAPLVANRIAGRGATLRFCGNQILTLLIQSIIFPMMK